MGNFTKSFDEVIEFDGDTISVNMDRMTNEQFKELSPFISDEGVMTIADQTKFMIAAAKVLPECINSISGMTIEGGKEVTKDNNFCNGVVFTNIYFLGFVAELTKRLMEKSFLRGDDVKKPQENQESVLLEPVEAQDSST